MKEGTTWIVEIDEDRYDQVIAALERKGLDLVTAKTTYTLNRNAIGEHRQKLRRIRGLRVYRRDSVYVLPHALRDAAEASDRRLSEAVEENTD